MRRQDLIALYETFRRTPFPESSNEEEAAELHADLALLDAECSGLIATAIGGDISSKKSLAADEWRLDDLRIRLRSLIREGSPLAVSDARRYLEYLEALHEIVRLVK